MRKQAKFYLEKRVSVGVLCHEARTSSDKNLIAMPPPWYENGARIYSDLVQVLEPVQECGLLLVEDLERLLMVSDLDMGRLPRLQQTYDTLTQYRMEHPMATIVGIPTDTDPVAGLEGVGMLHYGPLIQVPHVICALTEVDGVEHVVVGNDTIPVEEEEE
jgi:hypothetical protein